MVSSVRMIFLLALVSVVCFSCGGGSAGIFAESPSSVVKDAYMACNSGEYSKLDQYLSADTKKMVHSDRATAVGGLKKACDESSHNGTITSIEIKSETMRGEGATVVADIHFRDGSTDRGDVTELVVEDGKWKETAGGN